MTDTTSQLLASTVELWLERHPARAEMHPGAVGDVARDMLARGCLARGPDGRLVSRAGGSPEDVFDRVRRETPHRFRGPEEGAGAESPKPNPKGLSPSARLALANGEDLKAGL